MKYVLQINTVVSRPQLDIIVPCDDERHAIAWCEHVLQGFGGVDWIMGAMLWDQDVDDKPVATFRVETETRVRIK